MPFAPSPVNIERFFKQGAKFCRKKISSQALNCFLLLVHTASSFATGQKELMFQRKKSQCLRMKIWMISTLASLLPLHPPRQVQGLPVRKFQKQGKAGSQSLDRVESHASNFPIHLFDHLTQCNRSRYDSYVLHTSVHLLAMLKKYYPTPAPS